MAISIVVDLAQARRWHTWLRSDLESAGHVVVVRGSSSSNNSPMGLDSALHLDRQLHGLEREHACDRMRPDELARPPFSDAACDVAIQCTTDDVIDSEAKHVLRLLFNGQRSELGAIAAFVDGRQVEIEIEDARSGESLHFARPAVPNRRCITEALDAVLSRAVELILISVGQIVDDRDARSPGHSSNGHAAKQSTPRPPHTGLSALRHDARILTTKIKRKLSRQPRSRQRWALAIRPHNGSGLLDNLSQKRAAFRVVPDDGQRFYADPTLVEHDGRTWLFCEELPFETQRGVISVAEVDRSGSVGPMRKVLECPYHLSYPFVFKHDRRFWMIPETADNRTVDLYVSTDFPYAWKFERHLVEGAAVYDATPLQRQDHWLLLATTAHRSSTTWDALCIFRAETLDGPFKLQTRGSILIDAQLARPAGALLHDGDAIVRPAQDCSLMYGGAISITRFDPSTYQQTAVADVRVCAPAQLTGTHTYTRSAHFEAVDVWGAVDGIEQAILELCPKSSALPLQTQLRTTAPGSKLMDTVAPTALNGVGISACKGGVSVVIPAYNAASTLAQTLDSVLSQSLPPREIIVVNDGSTDATADVLAQYGSRVTAIHQQNAGLPGARNAGCRAAAGDYIAFIDADDIAEVDRFAIQHACLQSDPAIVLSYSDFSAFGIGDWVAPSHIRACYSTLGVDDDLSSHLGPRMTLTLPDDLGGPCLMHVGALYESLAHGNFVHPPTIMFRRGLFDDTGPFDINIRNMCDWDWIVRASTRGLFAYVDRPLIRYRLSPQQLHKNATAALDVIAITDLIRQRDPVLSQKHDARFRNALATRYLDAADALSETAKARTMQMLAKSYQLGGIAPPMLPILAKALLPSTLVQAVRTFKQAARGAGGA